MRILFVHQNFPAQFLHLAPALAARGHDVAALTAEDNPRASPVRLFRYRKAEIPTAGGVWRSYAEMSERGLRVARAAVQMRDAMGYAPEIVFGHGGWGETLFLREVWPAARHLTYAEFYYRSQGLDTGFDPEFPPPGPVPGIGTVARRAHLLQALADADAALSPTRWQASTFPPELRGKITVIHDGIDTLRVAPDPRARLVLPNGVALAAGDEVLTFVNRNLEPYRGYHIFMRALPEVLARRPAAQVVILGGEGQSYGPPPPGPESWKARFLGEVRGRLDLSRVHFLGQLPYRHYLALMQVSRVHAYLTYPFVLSWSMLEAMSAGTLVVASATAPVTEVIEDGRNGLLVDFFDVAGWARTLAEALADPARHDALRAAARETIRAGFDLRGHCLPRQIAFVEGSAPG